MPTVSVGAVEDVRRRLAVERSQTLARLADAGHVVGLCTNKPRAIARSLLGDLGLLPVFGAIIGGDSLPQRKPAPEPRCPGVGAGLASGRSPRACPRVEAGGGGAVDVVARSRPVRAA